MLSSPHARTGIVTNISLAPRVSVNKSEASKNMSASVMSLTSLTISRVS